MTWDPIVAAIAVVAAQGVNIAIVKAVVAGEIRKINGTYRRRELCDERHEGITMRLVKIEAAREH